MGLDSQICLKVVIHQRHAKLHAADIWSHVVLEPLPGWTSSGTSMPTWKSCWQTMQGTAVDFAVIGFTTHGVLNQV